MSMRSWVCQYISFPARLSSGGLEVTDEPRDALSEDACSVLAEMAQATQGLSIRAARLAAGLGLGCLGAGCRLPSGRCARKEAPWL